MASGSFKRPASHELVTRVNTVKIKQIRAFSIRSEMVGALYKEKTPSGAQPRRDPWTRQAQVAGPMSGYSQFKTRRSSWRLDGAVGCLVTAEDGTTGFGVSRHGRAVSAPPERSGSLQDLCPNVFQAFNIFSITYMGSTSRIESGRRTNPLPS